MNTQKTKAVEHDEDGVVIENTLPAVIDTGMVATMVRAELDTQIATARQYPRDPKMARKSIMDNAIMDEQSATECMYAMPRAGKPIRGPSVRLAEIIHQAWGNCRVEARVIDTDRVNKIITAEATFHDLQTNSAMRSVVQRRISDKRGRLYNDDMIVTTGNAACAIARRNAILAGVPKGIWRPAYEAAEQYVAGDIKTLSERRAAAIKAFATYGVTPEQIYATLDVDSVEDISLDDILTLQAMFAALKNKESTVEELFDARRTAGARSFDVVKNPLKDDPVPAPAGTVDDPSVGAAEGGEQGKPQAKTTKGSPATDPDQSNIPY